jgi:error-prone DNA polymerase
MRQLQRKTRRGDYRHLVIHSSIIRPAANVYIREYIRRLRGKPYTPLLPQLGEILEETYGIMCYQEDITKIAMEIAGFPVGEADEIRKVILKKSKVRRKLELKDKFFRNLLARKIAPETVEEIWRMIESFSGYSFCKPHSASYALLSFKCCYLKTRYPAEFMGAVLKNGGGYYSPLAYLSEVRRLGLRVEKPDINLSGEQYRGQGSTVHLGLEQIKGLCARSIRAIIAERERGGRFQGMCGFMERLDTEVGIADLVLLIKAGVFRNMESYNQPQLLYMARSFHARLGGPLNREIRSGLRPTPPPMRDVTPEQKLLTERELFGFMVSLHPMEHYRTKLPHREEGGASRIIRARDMDRYVGKTVEVAGILVTAKTVLTKNHQLMQFISFEDETALFETVFFPLVYKRHALSLSQHAPYVLRGKVEQEFGVTSLTVREVRPLG